MSEVTITVLAVVSSCMLAFLTALIVDKIDNKNIITRSCLNHLISLEEKKMKYEKAGHKVAVINCTRSQRHWMITKGGITADKPIEFDHVIALLHSDNVDKSFKKDGWKIIED